VSNKSRRKAILRSLRIGADTRVAGVRAVSRKTNIKCSHQSQEVSGGLEAINPTCNTRKGVVWLVTRCDLLRQEVQGAGSDRKLL